MSSSAQTALYTGLALTGAAALLSWSASWFHDSAAITGSSDNGAPVRDSQRHAQALKSAHNSYALAAGGTAVTLVVATVVHHTA